MYYEVVFAVPLPLEPILAPVPVSSLVSGLFYERSNNMSYKPWFAWYPVRIKGYQGANKVIDRWMWLTWVTRDKYANKPSAYRYWFLEDR